MRPQALDCNPRLLGCAGLSSSRHTIRRFAVSQSNTCNSHRSRLQREPAAARGGTSTRAAPVQGHGMSSLDAAAAANRPRRIALLECEDAEKWKGYTEKLWEEVLGRPGDEWRLYECWNGDFPTPADAASYDVLILSGSHYSAYEDVAWIQRLKQLLPQYVDAGARMYGTCFGCQILAEGLAGKVGPNPSGRFVLDLEQIELTPQLGEQLPDFAAVLESALDGVGPSAAPHDATSSTSTSKQPTAAGVQQGGATSSSPRQPHPSAAGLEQEAAALAAAGEQEPSAEGELADRLAAASLQSVAGSLQAAAAPPGSQLGSSVSKEPEGAAGSRAAAGSSSGQRCFQLVESHGDQVLQLPPGALHLATSSTARYEVWALYPNVLAAQFHPELGAGLALEKIWPALTANGRLSPEESAAARAALEKEQDHAHAMLQVIQHFVDHGLGQQRQQQQQQGGPGGGKGGGGCTASDSRAAEQGGTGASPGSKDSSSREQGAGGQTAGSSRPSAEGAGGGSSCANTTAAQAASGSSSQLLPVVAASEGLHLTVRTTPLSLTVRSTHSSRPGSPAPGSRLADGAGDGASVASRGGGQSPLGRTYSATSSPTVASARSSIAGSSSAAAVPFSKLAYQRQTADREERLSSGMHRLVNSVDAAFDLHMERLGLEAGLLQEMNDAVAAEYGQLGDVATALAQFSRDMAKRQAAVRDALASLPDLDRALTALEGRVGVLDAGSRQLAAQLGLKQGASANTVMGACLNMLQRS